MKLLAARYHTVLALFDLMDLSHQEIAEVLDISVEIIHRTGVLMQFSMLNALIDRLSEQIFNKLF